MACRFNQAFLHFFLVAWVVHVDEVDDNQAAHITQTQLTSDFIGGF